MSKKLIVTTLAAAIVAATLVYVSPAMREARFIDSLVARNLEARGGETAWEKVTSIRMAGLMDLGQDMSVPYVLEQKRPGKMCFEFEFDEQIATQCTDGSQGWKVTPFRGRSEPQAMTETEIRELADSSDPYGLLYDHRELDIDVLGIEQVDGRDAHKLQVNLPNGGVRWLYLDIETALETKLEATRLIAGREFMVETYYTEWRDVEGLLIPARQETRTVGDQDSHFLTVDTVVVNPTITDDRFHMPAVVGSNAS